MEEIKEPRDIDILKTMLNRKSQDVGIRNYQIRILQAEVENLYREMIDLNNEAAESDRRFREAQKTEKEALEAQQGNAVP